MAARLRSPIGSFGPIDLWLLVPQVATWSPYAGALAEGSTVTIEVCPGNSRQGSPGYSEVPMVIRSNGVPLPSPLKPLASGLLWSRAAPTSATETSLVRRARSSGNLQTPSLCRAPRSRSVCAPQGDRQGPRKPCGHLSCEHVALTSLAARVSKDQGLRPRSKHVISRAGRSCNACGRICASPLGPHPSAPARHEDPPRRARARRATSQPG
jgi:hypothetical protein